MENQLIKINRKRYKNLAKAAHNAHTIGRKTIPEIKKKGVALESHLVDLLHPDSTASPQDTTKAPNSASSIKISSLWSRLTIAVAVLCYGLPMFGVL